MALTENTATMRAILDAVRALPGAGSGSSGPAYGRAVFFGDSLAYGEGNGGRSYIDVLSESGIFEDVKKHAYSGATIGPYASDTTISEYCLINQIERYTSDVQNADIVFCQYQANDVNAVVSERVSMGTGYDDDTATTVCGYTRKAINRIYALNPSVRIIWLSSVRNDYAILYNNYHSNMDYLDASVLFEATVYQMIRTLGVSIIDACESFNWIPVSSTDSHPNNDGHIAIAENVLHNMFRTTHYITPTRPLQIETDNTFSSAYAECSFPSALKLLQAGVNMPVTIVIGETGVTMRAEVGSFGSYEIIINVITVWDNTRAVISMVWNSDGITIGYY